MRALLERRRDYHSRDGYIEGVCGFVKSVVSGRVGVTACGAWSLACVAHWELGSTLPCLVVLGSKATALPFADGLSQIPFGSSKSLILRAS